MGQSTSKPLRVIHVGTGPTGVEGLRTIIANPALELVGHFAVSPEKIGKDSGVLAGGAPIGVTATDNWDALLDLKADCLAYLGNGAGREDEVVEECCKFLERGTSVVSTSLIPLVHPATAPAAMCEKLEEACKKGGSAFLNSGIDPGFATTHLPVALSSIAGPIRQIRMLEISIYGDYPVVPIMRDIFGFGRPLDYERPMFQGGVMHWWEGTVRTVAESLDITLDEVRPVYQVFAHDSDIETTFGEVPAGTTACVHFRVEGLVGGTPVVVLEHVSRAAEDVAPQLPQPTHRVDHQYRVEIEGTPNFNCIIDMPEVDMGLKFTANHAVNAIPDVCAYKPGIIGPFDLPAYHGPVVRS